ncbi:MAG: hypothetical protein ACXAC8_02975 [Candidatus Hodarchaeales archaeon]
MGSNIDENGVESSTKFISKHSFEILLLTTGSILLLSIQFLITFSGLNRSTLLFELVFYVPFAIYVFAIFLTRSQYSEQNSYFLPILIFFAVLFQILILLTDVTLSDDLYRFFIEGKAVVNGVNPYVIPVEDFPLNLQDEVFNKVNNAYSSSPYPPLALILFAILYYFGRSPFFFRLFFSFAFIVSMVILNQLISHETRWKLLIYAWNPLLHLETANGSHFEAIVVFLVMLAIWSINSKMRFLAGVFFLTAFLLKFYAIFLVIVFWRKLGKNGMSIFLLGLFIYIFLVVLEPLMVRGLLIYAQNWYFNASVFWVLLGFLPDFNILKMLLGVIFIVILIRSGYTTEKNQESVHTRSLLVLGVFLLISPVFHPWYLFWIFPFVLLSDKMNYSWIFLSGLLIFSYHVYLTYDLTKIWLESDIMRIIEFVPFYISLLVENRGLITKIHQRFIHPLKSNQSLLRGFW